MKKYIEPGSYQWQELIQRPSIDHKILYDTVGTICEQVRKKGDSALKQYTRDFDKVEIDDLEIDANSWKEAEAELSDMLKNAIDRAAQNIEVFHRSQRQEIRYVETMPGVTCWRKQVPLDRVGLYIPGGSAPLFSTVLMLAIPARLAGCKDIVLCTPPSSQEKIHPAILYTAQISGVTRIFQVGGAQAIAAMAYGTESITPVNKILGPGNQYVTTAKLLVQQAGVAIDMPAGPSEVLVYADATADHEFVAADLLSQAEHGIDSQVVLLCDSEQTLEGTLLSIQKQIAELPRKEIARQALKNSLAIIFSNVDTAIQFSNFYAPEHLILACRESRIIAEKVQNAGSVFIGHYSPESVGDYASGTNHTLPTGAHAKAYSGVSLDSFTKKITFQELTSDGLLNIAPIVEAMAEAEQLTAHKNAVSIRVEKLKRR